MLEVSIFLSSGKTISIIAFGVPSLTKSPRDMGSIYLTYHSLCSHIRCSNCHRGTGRGYGLRGSGCGNGNK